MSHYWQDRFREVSYDAFRTMLTISLRIRLVTKEELADEFEVATSTVQRWVDGTASPHPLILGQINEFVMKRAKEDQSS